MSSQKDASSRYENSSQQTTPLCPYCQRRFHTLDELTLHIVTRHTQSGKGRGAAQAGSKS